MVEVSCRIEPGVIYAACGNSGSGKSTFLGLLAGIVTPTRGVVNVEACRPHLLTDVEFKAMGDYIQGAGTLARALAQVQFIPLDDQSNADVEVFNGTWAARRMTKVCPIKFS